MFPLDGQTGVGLWAQAHQKIKAPPHPPPRPTQFKGINLDNSDVRMRKRF